MSELITDTICNILRQPSKIINLSSGVIADSEYVKFLNSLFSCFKDDSNDDDDDDDDDEEEEGEEISPLLLVE